MKLEKFISKLKSENKIKVIEQEVDVYLELTHIAYVEVKKENSMPLLFLNPVDKKRNKKFDIPVIANLFANFDMIDEIIGDTEEIASNINNLIKLKPPTGFIEKIFKAYEMFSLRHVFPKRSHKKGLCQENVCLNGDIDLFNLPITTTWEQDSGAFITLGQVYTASVDGKINNLGMYRLQVHDKKTLGLHFQLHKDSNNFVREFKEIGKKMPVSIAIGGDPLYTWCGSAPLPFGIFELMLYGFIRKSPARLVKCVSNDLYVPNDSDIVIEGFLDPEKLLDEGPFGDHTGYYTLKEPYPFMEVSAITTKKNPMYLTTVVGKPPLEDKYLGYPTERIFLPLLQTTAPDLIDYKMPENGVFHNLILCKINVKYPSHAKQTMHTLWGVGQMSFVKHAIFVDKNAPNLEDYEALTKYILNRLDIKKILITEGICDSLDHSSPTANEGAKLGIDATGDEIENSGIEILEDEELLLKLKNKDFTELKQYMMDTKSPITVLKYKKTKSIKDVKEDIYPILSNTRVVFVIDDKENDVNNPYMLIWRIVNNIDAKRDIYFENEKIIIDATNKNSLDGFDREWPEDVKCTKSVLESLQKRLLIDIDDEFKNKFYL